MSPRSTLIDFAAARDRTTAILARRLLAFAIYDEVPELANPVAAVALRLDGNLTMVVSPHLSDLAVKMAACGLAARAAEGRGVPDGIRLMTLLRSEVALVDAEGLHGALGDVNRRLGIAQA